MGKLFKAGIYHSDLNINNILFDGADNVWIVDFDKCVQRTIGKKPKNKRTMPEKMEIKKFDPVVRKHVIYKEGKIK